MVTVVRQIFLSPLFPFLRVCRLICPVGYIFDILYVIKFFVVLLWVIVCVCVCLVDMLQSLVVIF